MFHNTKGYKKEEGMQLTFMMICMPIKVQQKDGSKPMVIRVLLLLVTDSTERYYEVRRRV